MSNLAFRINKEEEVLESFYDNEWHKLGGKVTSSSEGGDTKLSKVIREQNSYIKAKYRDHTDVENGSMNFVSPFLRYLGYYSPENAHAGTQEDEAAPEKRFVVPNLFRFVGDHNFSIETVKKTDTNFNNSPVVLNSARRFVYTSEFQAVDSTQFESGITWTHYLTGETITYRARSANTFKNMKVLRTHQFDYKIGSLPLNEDNHTEIVGFTIDWNLMPTDAYWVVGCIKHRTPYESLRLLITNHGATTSPDNGGNIYAGFSSKIKTLQEVDGKYVHPDSGKEFTKISRPENGRRYTIVMLETKGKGSADDSLRGLVFNMYVPEHMYYECTKGWGESQFVFINAPSYNSTVVPNINPLGKFTNAFTTIEEDTCLPSYPKNGDVLKVINNINGHRDGLVKYQEYVCMIGNGFTTLEDYNHNITNATLDKRLTYTSYNFPSPLQYDDYVVSYYLGGRLNEDGSWGNYTVHSKLTHFRKIEPTILPNMEEIEKAQKDFIVGIVTGQGDRSLLEINNYYFRNSNFINLEMTLQTISPTLYYSDSLTHIDNAIILNKEYEHALRDAVYSDSEEDGYVIICIRYTKALQYPSLLKAISNNDMRSLKLKYDRQSGIIYYGNLSSATTLLPDLRNHIDNSYSSEHQPVTRKTVALDGSLITEVLIRPYKTTSTGESALDSLDNIYIVLYCRPKNAQDIEEERAQNSGSSGGRF